MLQCNRMCAWLNLTLQLDMTEPPSPPGKSSDSASCSKSHMPRLLDNVLSDYLWAKAVLLTTPTATTAGLSIQVPLAAIVDTLRGHPPHLLNYLGAASIMVGFVGINIPSEWWGSRVSHQEQDAGSIAMVDRNNDLPISSDAAALS